MTAKLLCFFFAGPLAFLLSGCASAPSRHHTKSALKTGTIASNEIQFDDFRAVVERADLVLTGAVRRKDGFHRAFGGHIDLAVLDASGLTVTALSAILSPNFTFRARLSYFRVVIPAWSTPNGHAIAAFHLPESSLEGRGTDCGDNQALTKDISVMP